MSASTTPGASAQDYRLPTDVKPSHYDLTVWTDLENNTFEGVVHVEYVALPCAQLLWSILRADVYVLPVHTAWT